MHTYDTKETFERDDKKPQLSHSDQVASKNV